MTNEQKRIAIKLGEKLARECKHEEIKQVGAYPQFNFDSSAHCAICDRDLGWWCPSEDSPNHVCEYFGLHNHSYSKKEYYDEDDCIYCHNPEERK